VTREEFEALAREALESLPPEFREKLKDLAFIIKDEPDKAELRAVGIRSGTLYGLFQGVPLPDTSFANARLLPDRIVLYQRPLERDFRTREGLAEQIRATVLHEVGHFFGFSEKDLRRLGYG
jgi:predicted Zn-dependent protease with MMP-like domain